MRIAMIGTGYVGLVSGACFAEFGLDVVCVDKDESKIAMLREGRIPIYEPGLEALVERHHAGGRLSFTTSLAEAVSDAEAVFIAVGTPTRRGDGHADLTYVFAAAEEIASHLKQRTLVVTKSTVPVGTADKVGAAVAESLNKRGAELEFDVVSNPEFLKEGAAIDDFMRPDRVVVGADNPRVLELLRALYEPFTRSRDKIICMDIRSAELTKYAANAMLATKISFMNELANLAERFGADIEKVRVGIGSDQRIGYHFIYPGLGYGGSCFPKDVQALVRSARGVDYEPRLLDSVEAVNKAQKEVLPSKILRHYGGNIAGKTFAIWGLAFKPGTDDMREAPSRVLMEALWKAGAKVRAYDPAAAKEARRIWGDRADLTLCARAKETLEGADALVIVTEWKEFRSPDFDALKKQLKAPVIFDGRNLYDPAFMKKLGYKYYAIGRGDSAPG
jgi:UDPglucose 6-dehydrogenase